MFDYPVSKNFSKILNTFFKLKKFHFEEKKNKGGEPPHF